MNWKVNHFINQIHRTSYKRYECYIVTNLLHDPEFLDLEPRTQHYAKRLDGNYALIDLYYPQLKIAVEIDEPHHEGNMSNDINRQNDVEKQLNCTFYRFNVTKGGILDQLNEFKSILRKKYADIKRDGNFTAWLEPRRLDIFEAKKEFKNTLFIKIRGEIHPQDLEERQTGLWRISQNNKDKIDQIIVIHDGEVTRVTKEIQWTKLGEKSSYKGRIVEDSELIGTIIHGWKTQQTITYSYDIIPPSSKGRDSESISHENPLHSRL